MASLSTPLIAVDIGNKRLKLGRFEAVTATGLPEPIHACSVTPEDLTPLGSWLEPVAEPACWHIGSVNRPTTGRLLDWLHQNRPSDKVVLLASGDLPLEIDLPRPDMVGIDRLIDAVAANRIRTSDRPAVVVDVGSAITVDVVSPDGVFLGGAILPGIAMSAKALHTFTDLLPEVPMDELGELPPSIGTETVSAIRAGLFWGAVGAIRELECRASERFGIPAQVMLTGGAGTLVAKLLGDEACYVPHLTLSGIAVSTAEHFQP